MTKIKVEFQGIIHILPITQFPENIEEFLRITSICYRYLPEYPHKFVMSYLDED
jgi:hypothetical protein